MNEPQTLSEALTRISRKLESLTWTHVIWGRVHRHDLTQPGTERPYAVPMVYLREGEYGDVRPDSQHPSVLFFYTEQPEANDFDRAKHSPPHAIRTTRPVTLYGWLNLLRLQAADPGDDGFAEQVKLSLKSALRDVTCITRIGNYEEGEASRVFRPFTIENKATDKWPFLCFRLELEIMTVER